MNENNLLGSPDYHLKKKDRLTTRQFWCVWTVIFLLIISITISGVLIINPFGITDFCLSQIKRFIEFLFGTYGEEIIEETHIIESEH
jgi:hypothetical protein